VENGTVGDLVSGFPTVVAFHNGRHQSYDGPRTVDGLQAFSNGFFPSALSGGGLFARLLGGESSDGGEADDKKDESSNDKVDDDKQGNSESISEISDDKADDKKDDKQEKDGDDKQATPDLWFQPPTWDKATWYPCGDITMVYGDTKPRKEDIKKHGGVWNASLKAWIFDKDDSENIAKLGTVEELPALADAPSDTTGKLYRTSTKGVVVQGETDPHRWTLYCNGGAWHKKREGFVFRKSDFDKWNPEIQQGNSALQGGGNEIDDDKADKKDDEISDDDVSPVEYLANKYSESELKAFFECRKEWKDDTCGDFEDDNNINNKIEMDALAKISDEKSSNAYCKFLKSKGATDDELLSHNCVEDKEYDDLFDKAMTDIESEKLGLKEDTKYFAADAEVRHELKEKTIRALELLQTDTAEEKQTEAQLTDSLQGGNEESDI